MPLPVPAGPGAGGGAACAATPPTGSRSEPRWPQACSPPSVTSPATNPSSWPSTTPSGWTRPPRPRSTFVLRRCTHEPLALVATRRAGTIGHLDLSAAFGGRGVRELVVGPMDRADLEELVRSRSALGRSAVRRVSKAAAGNPFFALEIAQLLGAQDECRGRRAAPAARRRCAPGLTARGAVPGHQAGARWRGPLGRAHRGRARAGWSPPETPSSPSARHRPPVSSRSTHWRGTTACGSTIRSSPTPSPRAWTTGSASLLHRRLALAVATPEERARHLAGRDRGVRRGRGRDGRSGRHRSPPAGRTGDRRAAGDGSRPPDAPVRAGGEPAQDAPRR